MIALDTNICLYAYDRAAPEHQAAMDALARGRDDPGGWGAPLPVLAEFWSGATRPTRAGDPNLAATAEFWNTLTANGLRVWLASAELPRALLATARRLRARGRRIYDLQIALIALENGADELWTHDTNFLRLPGLRYFDPITRSATR